MMELIYSILLVLSVFHTRLIARADKKFGCLFEADVCKPYEICVNDGIFGRCQLVTVIDVYKYEVSPTDLQRLRAILQELSLRGLMWHDDTTQQVIGKELSNLHRTYHLHPEAGSSDSLRATKQKIASKENYEEADDGDLQGFKSLHQYLQLLSALSQPANPMPSHKTRIDKSEATQTGSSFDDFLQRNGGKTSSSHFPAFHHQYLDSERTQPRLLSQLQQQRENFIQSVVQQLGTQHVNVDGLTSMQLDELSGVIADALQVVDDDRTNEENKYGREAKQDFQQKEEEDRPEKTINRDELILEKQDDEVNERFPDQSQTFKTEDESDEDKKRLFEILDLDSLYIDPHKNQVKKSDSSSKEMVGVENVKSNTIAREVTNTRNSESGTFGSEEQPAHPDRWVDGSLMYEEPQKKNSQIGDLRLDVASSKSNLYGYIVTQQNPLSVEKGLELMEDLARLLKLQMNAFSDVNIVGPAVTFQVNINGQNVSTADVVNVAVGNKENLEKETGLKILQTGMGEKSKLRAFPQRANEEDSTKFIILTIISIVCIIGVLVASGVIYCLRHRSHHKLKEKLGTLGHDATASSDATNAYQELCRQRMAVKTSERPEPAHSSRINSVSSQFSDGPQPSPSTRSSTSSWCEEPVQSNMDISTGHMILSYMEDHLRNKNRLVKEWEALGAYQAEPNTSSIADREENEKKNRSQLVVPYDHSRVTLKAESSHSNSDYINASPIMDHDPRNPAYIASQGPLPATVADFWQMVWENGCVVIVMLTPLTENGVKQCYHYWPDEGSNLYHIYEVNLVSEHIWCEDFLVRSFYLKNLQTNETRTVTQFHFLSWFDQAVPSSTRSLLDFRRKVNKCYRGRSCPIIVHCSDGAGRCGTYILIDMVLNRMAKGAKEIDIAATLEHLRDQRPMMVQTKEQFEFALTAVAEEVNAILKALPQ
ncbi:receptor-type tyrosine-protein phosphatase N2 isoform X2 [Heptranchias perlo]|uniref:receptor-type tyrosine-protein phosphatase N2 isoform X2 n=1 Tax=Heptranchias perlo TaxID=212740 RepID=UPI0035595C32